MEFLVGQIQAMMAIDAPGLPDKELQSRLRLGTHLRALTSSITQTVEETIKRGVTRLQCRFKRCDCLAHVRKRKVGRSTCIGCVSGSRAAVTAIWAVDFSEHCLIQFPEFWVRSD
ncbi:hypothetical protein WS46_29690 [Burkholderia sp. RF4-BP95]|nr:hypothetical protein WS46_29690 [Burkholderia sp. RF4-BP95]